jgi:hypothetical protein
MRIAGRLDCLNAEARFHDSVVNIAEKIKLTRWQSIEGEFLRKARQ